ncbi:MAG: hypothetical protein IT369_24255 [Candidatus Latescibacteria bacterium]|nr:hypothetical protein [Candidatus Latescibacterota bacterium]
MRCLTLCWLLVATGLCGCLEAIRRPSPDGSPPREAVAPASPDPAATPAPARRPAGKPHPAAANARQVNEYAFWCIGKGLWQEARLHLEQAAQRDSLTASYQNNLAVIYEHLGLEEQAAAAYRRAQALQPGQKPYQENVRRFEIRQRAAHPDSTIGPRPDSTSTQTDSKPSTGE